VKTGGAKTLGEEKLFESDYGARLGLTKKHAKKERKKVKGLRTKSGRRGTWRNEDVHFSSHSRGDTFFFGAERREGSSVP